MSTGRRVLASQAASVPPPRLQQRVDLLVAHVVGPLAWAQRVLTVRLASPTPGNNIPVAEDCIGLDEA
eukprot:CAMPEP_0171281924 /NCGR_PEP_ID=MMETSP0790-20130122/66649_1 /TAXON_ID=2925 /ORGANISM="Alexandrium catenella, Strain OF101" /LENGTH=67 /DNA_ID=CAMNT_0011751155 /DNA_START=225 /DNA_END=426 /DNA_ORIENTATION=-